jgi:hypothetical protein
MADDLHARLGRLARDAATGETSRQAHLEGRARLIAAVEGEREGRGAARRPRARWILAASAAALAMAVAVLFFVRARPIGWTVEGNGTGEHAYVVAPAGRDAALRFDDGSEVALAEGGRARVAETTADGADLLLEEGRADVHVVHRARTRWRVLAGPYTVVVTGTRFVVGWSGARGALQVAMREGTVRVTGPGMREGLALSAPQQLDARASDGALAIGSALPPEQVASALAPSAAELAPSAPLPTLPLPLPSSSTAPAPSAATLSNASSAPVAIRWSALVAAGRYADVLSAAKPLGAAALERSLDDVQAIADAARLGGDPALAEQALLAIRRRFPGTGNATTAAFLIGRLAEEQQKAPGKARQWYDRYLAEAPSGAFAADALGRKMLLVDRLDGRASAAPLARDYLARFPKGAYAKSARTIAGVEGE